MTVHRLDYELTLAVRSPFLFRGLEAKFVGVDVAHLRDEEGYPIIPADQLRGVFRQALGWLQTAGALPPSTVVELFGRPSGGMGHDEKEREALESNEPSRGRIRFSDLRAATLLRDPDARQPSEEMVGPRSASGETTRIKIDDALGSVEAGAMQVLELVAPLGSAVVFRGDISLFDEVGSAGDWRLSLTRALALVSSIGAMKSPGWGEVLQEHSGIRQKGAVRIALAPTPVESLPERLRLRVRFDRPILVDAEKISDNAVEGRTIIPGAVFKGALAHRLKLGGEALEEAPISTALTALGFSHAFPEVDAAGTLGDKPLPYSLVHADPKKDRIGILADASRIPFGRGGIICGKAARFPTDWKTPAFTLARRYLGLPESDIPRLVRAHTAIDGDTGTALEHKLFTTLARSVRHEVPVDEYASDTPTDAPVATRWVDRTWTLDVDLGGVSEIDRPTARRLIATLLEDGLDGIGRTGATATFERLTDTPLPRPAPIRGTSDLYAVVLDTPALLLDGVAECGGGSWRRSASEAYRDYWRAALGDPDLELRNVFAAQTWKGGYIARRHRLYGAYHPFLLTSEGSVFVLRTTASTELAHIARYGLPPPTIETGGAVDWRTCPYVRENGYGHIRFHLADANSAELVDAVMPDAEGGDAPW